MTGNGRGWTYYSGCLVPGCECRLYWLATGGRPRHYATRADRQRAYRERKKAR
jgi:hypothetical protein